MPRIITMNDGREYVYETVVGDGQITRVLLVEAQQQVREASLDDAADE